MNKKAIFLVVSLMAQNVFSEPGFIKKRWPMLLGSAAGLAAGLSVSEAMSSPHDVRSGSIILCCAGMVAGFNSGWVYRYHSKGYTLDDLITCLGSKRSFVARRITDDLLQKFEIIKRELIRDGMIWRSKDKIVFGAEFFLKVNEPYYSLAGPKTNSFGIIEKTYRVFPILSAYEHLRSLSKFLDKKITHLQKLMPESDEEFIQQSEVAINKASELVTKMRKALYLLRSDPYFGEEKKTYRQIRAVPYFHHFDRAEYVNGRLSVDYTTVKITYIYI